MLAGNTQPPEDADTQRLNEIVHSQPALFTIEYALARMWTDLGVVPRAIVGHSMGEYVAACLAGVFSLEDALRLLVRRTRLVEQLPPARMIAVNLSEAELQTSLPKELSISLDQRPESVRRRCGPTAGHVEAWNFAQGCSPRAMYTFRDPCRIPTRSTPACSTRSLAPSRQEARKVRRQRFADSVHLERHGAMDHRGRGDRSGLLRSNT